MYNVESILFYLPVDSYVWRTNIKWGNIEVFPVVWGWNNTGQFDLWSAPGFMPSCRYANCRHKLFSSLSTANETSTAGSGRSGKLYVHITLSSCSVMFYRHNMNSINYPFTRDCLQIACWCILYTLIVIRLTLSTVSWPLPLGSHSWPTTIAMNFHGQCKQTGVSVMLACNSLLTFFHELSISSFNHHLKAFLVTYTYDLSYIVSLFMFYLFFFVSCWSL